MRSRAVVISRWTLMILFLSAAVRPVDAGPVDAADVVSTSIRIERAFIRLSAPGLGVGAGYLTIRNLGPGSDELLGANSPRAQRVQVHSTSMQGGVTRMREVSSVPIAAGSSVALVPGGLHLMVMGFDPDLRAGETLPIELRFRSGVVRVDLPLRTP